MFKQIVSSLPFNPSLISKLADYDQKLKKEIDLRFIALFLMLFLFFIQVMVTIVPPISSQDSPNDLVSGGFSSISQVFNSCLYNSNYQTVLNHYSINCSDIYNAKSINLRLNYDNGLLFSLNRLAYGAKNEKETTINGSNYWIRGLDFGNSLQTLSYKALKIIKSSGTFYILMNSGNLVSSQNNLVTPKKEICSIINQTACLNFSISVRDQSKDIPNSNQVIVSAGDNLIYTLLIRNASSLTIKSYSFNINFSNAFAYSYLLNSYGGIEKNDNIAYKLVALKPHEALTKEISTVVRNNISAQSISASDSNYYALKMITTFGNTLYVGVSGSFNKFYEININNKLPTLGSTLSLIILASIILVMVYFLLRALLIRQEIKLIKNDQSEYRHRS
ncbi:MAG TPA: hypothetical protein VMR76_02330 [Candidatus Saccharimonadia bacterium]|nr:hypothetical protein [Candidatus Saccharimonadia bacterium]